MHRPTVAISDDFLTAFAGLPRAQQKKVREFTEKFRANPAAGSIHYEPIHGCVDQKVRTVRIGNDYRAVVIHPPAGEVYLLVWVDHHDEAMAWARRKRFEVNPTTGGIQMYEVREGAPIAAPQVAPPSSDPSVIPPGRLFSGINMDDLMILGVPEPLLPAVRALRTEADLAELGPFLPKDARTALFQLASGATPDEVLAEQDRQRVKEKIETSDFEAALSRETTAQHFKVVESEQELTDILKAPLALWRIFLHPSQRKLAEWKVAGPACVLGGAGTGKTVVAIHRARFLAKAIEDTPDARILFTTYTRNLARDIERDLELLCGRELVKKIEVANLHQWAHQFLRARKVEFELASERDKTALWDAVVAEFSRLSLSPVFLREEWQFVVQAQDVLDAESYYKASRRGRGTRLSRKQKADVWAALSHYRSLLEEQGKLEPEDLIREARLCLERNPEILPYVGVIADELQDFRTSDLRLLRAIVPKGANDMFLVGDAHQRIYRHKASLGECGIDVRGRSRRLRLNYRTTEQIRRWSVALLEGVEVDDLDGGKDSLHGYRSLREGVAPTVKVLPSREEELSYIVSRVRAWLERIPAEEICVAARTNALIEEVYRPKLEAAGVRCVALKTDAESTAEPGAVRLATMHRLKGLEFPRLILADFSDGVMPLQLGAGALADEASGEDHEEAERCLAYVAASRARDELVVTCSGRPSKWL